MLRRERGSVVVVLSARVERRHWIGTRVLIQKFPLQCYHAATDGFAAQNRRRRETAGMVGRRAETGMPGG